MTMDLRRRRQGFYILFVEREERKKVGGRLDYM
jgi:hypothetical protein